MALQYYYTTGACALLNFRAEYDLNIHFTVAAGARNLLDQNCYLSDGYPEVGHSYYASMKATIASLSACLPHLMRGGARISWQV